MLRVGVNARFLTQPITGVQRYALELCRVIPAVVGDRVRLVLFVPPGALHSAPPDDVELVRDSSKLGPNLWQQVRLLALARQHATDLLWSPCNTGPVLAPRHVVTIHDASVFGFPAGFSWWFGGYYRWMLRALGRRALRVVTDSSFSQSELVRWRVVTEDRIRVVPAGVAESFFRAGERGPGSRPYVLVLGSRDPRKNLRGLLEAWQALPAETKGGRVLRVAGGGSAKFANERLRELPADVERTGPVPDRELPALYASADAFVFVSLYEGFGLPPLEAMASGVPTLVSDVPPMVDVCGDAALRCDPSRVEDITDKLRTLLRDEALRGRLGAAGPARAAEFSWARAARALVEVFEEAAALRLP